MTFFVEHFIPLLDFTHGSYNLPRGMSLPPVDNHPFSTSSNFRVWRDRGRSKPIRQIESYGAWLDGMKVYVRYPSVGSPCRRET